MIFGSWVLQILLSEILGVPTTLETGRPDAVMQYYDEEARFEFGTTSNNLQAFRNAVELGNGDCRNIVQNSTDSDDYLNCAHVIPEVWTARSKQVQEYIREDILDPPLALGALGIEGWYIPKFTAESDPTLTSWIGLQGDENRHKLAQTFKRPTTWMDYCEQISPDNCTTPDEVAQRPPEDERESGRLHKSGVFTGYFRPTERGDCETNPTNCTGHIGDFPCGWGGSLEATCHWLDIALESNGQQPNSGGYTYGQLGQLWRAANETRNHVAMMWVVPDPVYEEFLGTDFEFVKVTLPAPTQKCQQFKINPENRCSDDPELRLGTAEGVCDETARPLHKLMLSKFYDLTQDPSIPEAIRNPAHPVVSQFSLSELQINDMFRYWLMQPDEPREAICQFVIDNLDDLEQFLPRSYPRTIRHSSSDKSSPSHWLSIATSVLGVLATLLVLVTAALVYHHRGRRVLRYAQIEFLYLLLMGSAMISVAAILTGLQTPPSNVACISQIWLVSLGYTLELVPLLFKVGAINSLMQAARRMRRVQLKRVSLHGGVAFIGLLVAVFLITWTVVDPPQKQAYYELTDQVLVNGDADNNHDSASLFDTTVVQVQYFCSSKSEAWQYVTIAWNLILILCATAIAFQSRTVKQHFNEAQVLSRLIYAHFLFVLLRVMSQFFEPAVGVPMVSIIYSLDTICMVLVYFVPKFLADDHQTEEGSAFFSSTNFRVSGITPLDQSVRPFSSRGSPPNSLFGNNSYPCGLEQSQNMQHNHNMFTLEPTSILKSTEFDIDEIQSSRSVKDKQVTFCDAEGNHLECNEDANQKLGLSDEESGGSATVEAEDQQQISPFEGCGSDMATEANADADGEVANVDDQHQLSPFGAHSSDTATEANADADGEAANVDGQHQLSPFDHSSDTATEANADTDGEAANVSTSSGESVEGQGQSHDEPKRQNQDSVEGNEEQSASTVPKTSQGDSKLQEWVRVWDSFAPAR